VTARPDRVLGLHFFSPVPLMNAVEVVRGLSTSEETASAGAAFVRRIGKEPIRVNPRRTGFRSEPPQSALHRGGHALGGRRRDDAGGHRQGRQVALGRKMGIFETGDLVGLDVTHGALLALYDQTRDPGGTLRPF